MNDENWTRRNFIASSLAGAGAFLTACAHRPLGVLRGRPVQRNQVVEFTFRSSERYTDPYNDVELEVHVHTPSGQRIAHPAFWAGGRVWKARVTGHEAGDYTCRTVCSNGRDGGLHGQTRSFSVNAGQGKCDLLNRGRLQVAEDRRHFEHLDGTPFFWIGDTWWMGLCSRLEYPSGFRRLARDRKEKGFNVVQIVAGPYPDMDAWDPRGENEAGFPFTKGFEAANPAYFKHADRKLIGLVESGFVPCIVGMWGYYLPIIGAEKIKRYWRYLVARYGAYPVVWCAAGEGTMAYYLSKNKKKESAQQKKGWTEVAAHIRETDGYRNLVTIHPTQYGREMVEDASLLDFEMLQTGHSDLDSVPNTAKSVIHAKAQDPKMPVINSEVNYEGILGRSWQNVQRLCFYASVLNGAAGHTYGANGIWQMSTPDRPYGLSPHGRSWGNTSWQEAHQLPGSAQVGIGGRFIQRFPWWRLERHPEWVKPECDPQKTYSCTAAGIPRELRVIYIPMLWNAPLVRAIEPDVRYEAYYFDPVKGDEVSIGAVQPNGDGEWTPPLPPEVHDWLLVMRAV